MLPTIRTNNIYTKKKTNINHVGILYWLPNHEFVVISDGPGPGSHEDGVSLAVMEAGRDALFVAESSSSSEHFSSTFGKLMSLMHN